MNVMKAHICSLRQLLWNVDSARATFWECRWQVIHVTIVAAWQVSARTLDGSDLSNLERCARAKAPEA